MNRQETAIGNGSRGLDGLGGPGRAVPRIIARSRDANFSLRNGRGRGESMDRPRVASGIFGWACGPHQSIRPLVGACAPGHHGNPRATVLIRSKASRAMCGARLQLRREDRCSIVFVSSREPRRDLDYLPLGSDNCYAALSANAASYLRA